MVFKPDTEDDAYTSLETELKNQISDLTNFEVGSFNNVWVDAFAQGVREVEVEALAAQLSGWIDYAGGPITETDLDHLDIDSVTPEELNEFMEDDDLEELVKIVGINRDDGIAATGTVTFTTANDSVVIPKGTEVGTTPDENGDSLIFTTDKEVQPANNQTTVDADITAEEKKEEYNVGSSTVVYMPSPPAGVQSVTNSSSITGGVDPETNDELRERAKEAVFSTSGGGTSDGIIGFIEQNTDAGDVLVKEFTSATPPYADVIVDGGTTSDINDAIDESKPVGIKHNLVRPSNYNIDVDVDVKGTDIDTSEIESDLDDHISVLGLGQDVFRDKLFQIIFNSDEDVNNTTSLDILVTDESHTYSTGTDKYQIDKFDDMDLSRNVDEIRGTLNSSSHTFTKNTDYSVIDDNADSDVDTIDWSLGGDSPDDSTDFFIDYYIDDDLSISDREKAIAGTMTVTVV